MSDDRDPFDQYHEYVEQQAAALREAESKAALDAAQHPKLIDVLVRIAEALEERNYMEWMRLEEDGIVTAVDMPEPDKGGDLPS